jgi:DNA gyrase subunit A
MVVTLVAYRLHQAPAAGRLPSQKRGGRGKQAAAIKDDDFVDRLFIANTHDYILCFSSRGRVYWLKVYEAPEGARNSRGKPIVNYVPAGKR